MNDMIAEDLLTAQEELQEKNDEIKRLKEKFEKFHNLVEDLHATPFTGIASGGFGGEWEAEDKQLRNRIEQSSVEFAAEDTHVVDASVSTGVESSLRDQLAEEQRQRQALEVELQNTKDQYEARLKAAETLASSHIEAEKQCAEAAQNALNEQMNRMDIDSRSQEQNQQLIANYEAEIQEQRQRCNQFKKMSERLTTQFKQAVDAKRELERSNQELRHTIEDMKSTIAALQLHIREYRMPGSFADGGSQ
jgi:chromosome segregation ATPase